MPAWSAAWITVWPSATSTFRPSISSVGMRAELRRGGLERAAPEARVLLELGAVLRDERAHWHGGGVGERADGVAHHVAGDVEQQVDVRRLGVALFETVQHVLEPARALTARRALPARLVVEEV